MSKDDRNEKRQDIADLQENINKQQAKISALKELVRKSGEAHGKSSSTQEKVKNIAKRLTHLKTKARSRQSAERSISEFRDEPIFEESTQIQIRSTGSLSPTSCDTIRSESSGSDKIQLLRQQMEKNKLKIAERENSKREIEVLVTQLKAKIDSTQQSLERSSELGRSVGDLTGYTSNPLSGKYKSATDLSFTPLNLDREKIKFLENRVKTLEKQLEKEKNVPKTENEIIKTLESKILDLEESLKERDCIIQARTQAVSLMTESFSAKGKNTVDLLEDTKQEMFKMQSNFIETEEALKSEIKDLKLALEEREKKVANLEEVNDVLETARFDLAVKNLELESKIQNIEDSNSEIIELKKVNENLQQRIAGGLEIQSKSGASDESTEIAQKVEDEHASIVKNLQDRINVLEKENDELKKLIQEVHDVQDESNSKNDAAVKIKSLESTINAQREDIENHITKIQQLEDKLAEKTIECNVLNANFSVLEEKLKASTPRPLFSNSSYEEAEVEINKLKTQLDEANKAMIKMKLKAKQLQKQVDGFNKISDVHAELTKISGENEQLQQKILELEEEKGQLQLKLLSGEPIDANDTELEKKIQILETTCQNQTSAIQLLEEQKLDMTENLHTTKQELESLKVQIDEREETARVTSQIETIQLEEKVNNYFAENSDLKNEIERYKNENEKLQETIQTLQLEKEELNKKVDHYIAENIELLDKIEKLSKSSSSAESIEIVERLTQQEKLEIEEFNKRLEEEHHKDIVDNVETPAQGFPNESGQVMGQELSESLTKLREESSELMHRIELFTAERREVLEKMELLTNENQEHVNRIEELVKEKSAIEADLSAVKEEKMYLGEQYDALKKERDEIFEQIADGNRQKELLTEQINILKKEQNSANDMLQASRVDDNFLEDCESSLSRLSREVENFSKATDKASRVSSCKKLVKEAKNACLQISELLQKIKVLQGEREEDERGQITGEFAEKLQKDLEEALVATHKKDEEISNLVLQIESLRKVNEEKEALYKDEISQLRTLRKDVETRLQTANDEIDILKTLVAEQKQQLIESCTQQDDETSSKLEMIEQYEADIKKLRKELEAVQNQKFVEQLKDEITKLELLLNENKQLTAQQAQELINKQETIDTMNTQIVELYRTIEEITNKVGEKQDEINMLEELLDTKSHEINKLSHENDENKKVMERLLLELHSQTEKIAQVDSLAGVKEQNRQLEARVKELEKLNFDSEIRCKEQHDKLKKFAANLKRKVAQCSELENKVKQLTETVKEADESRTKADSIDFQNINTEIAALNQKLCMAEDNMQKLIEEKEFLGNELNRKHSELDHAKHQLEIYITKLEETTIQLGEMQNLVEILHSDFDEKSRNEQHLQEQISLMQKQHDDKLKSLMEEHNAKNVKFEKCKAVLKEKMREIQRLSSENGELMQKLHAFEDKSCAVGTDIVLLQEENAKLKQDYAMLFETYEKEKATFQDTIARLETLHDGIQAKLQEDMAYIESIELENNKFKEKICKLEECVALFEERRASLEKQANLLDAQLQERQDEYEKNEDALVYRLNMLSEHDDLIGRRLLETQEEKYELTEKLERSKCDYKELLDKFIKLEKEFETFQKEKYENIEQENISLQRQVDVLQTEIGKVQSFYESKLAAKTAEIDDLENDLSVQLKNLSIEKKSLQEDLEKSRDEVTALKDENVKLKENSNTLEQIKNDLERDITWIRMQNENLSEDHYELQELRMQVMQDKTELENQKHQLETVVQNHEIELNVLRTQIAELDSMRMQVSQNQTDDQVFIETENKRLKELLAEKEAIIDNYQRQNLQLQMSALSPGANDPFATISEGTSVSSDADQIEINSLKQDCRAYETEISYLKGKLREKDEEQNKIAEELTHLRQEVQRITLEKQREIEHLNTELERLRGPQNELASAFNFDQPSSNVFEDLITVNQSQLLEAGAPDQKKIKDLERNVSDLEKYTAELENKLRQLTNAHEEALRQLKKKNVALSDLEKNTTLRITDLEEKERQQNIQQSIEQIWSNSVDPNALNLKMFFDASQQTQVDTSESNVPVVEETIVPKKAYICHPKAEPDYSSRHNLEEDWAWGSEEAALEEKHYHSAIGPRTSLLSPDTNIEVQFQEYEDRIKELELERDRLEEQKVELQVKSGKMMKKLKEYKNKIAQLSDSQGSFRKSASIESSDLDLAIQEELKSQVQKLEEKVLELKRQIEKGAVEKENHLKRIDVLTMANERLTELKERQDVELEAKQTQIRQLSQKLKALEDWSGNSNQVNQNQSKLDSNTESKEDWEKKYLDLSQEIKDLKVDRDELQALLDEEKENCKLGENKIQTLQAKISSLEKDIMQYSEKSNVQACMEVEHQALKNKFNELKLNNQTLQLQLSDYQTTVELLSTESNSIKTNLDILREEHKQKLNENSKLTNELQLLVGKNDELSKEIEAMRLSTSNISKTPEDHTEYEQKIADLEARLTYLGGELLSKNNEISKLLKEKEELMKVKTTLEHEISDNNLELTQLREKVENITKERTEMQEKITALEGSLVAFKSEKEHMENELQILNNHVISSLENEDKMKQTILELDMKNIEISELKKSLETLKTHQIEHSQFKDNINEDELQELNKHWESIVEQRCGEVAEMWRAHLAEKENEFSSIEKNLRQEIEKLETYMTATNEPKTDAKDDEDVETNSEIELEKMQAALESQELEIVTLKEQLAMRSAEYARLAAQHDPYAQTTTSSAAFDLNVLRKTVNIDQSSLVQKSELDLALYMLHQRDMKCEELTLELVNLLEERDTLQLKLSNSLRQIEEIRIKTGYAESGSESDQGIVSNPNSPEKSKTVTSGEITEEEIFKENEGLNMKISQLHTITHSKDKRLIEERSRGQRDLGKIQEDVANMPSEAVSELVGKDLTTTSQSPSTVLLNWLWGKTNTSQEN